MTFQSTAAFFRRLMRLGRPRRRPASHFDTLDPAGMGTAYGLESTMTHDDDVPLLQRLSVESRSMLRPPYL